MDKINVLILAFDRPDALALCLEKLAQHMNVGKYYLYIDKFYDSATRLGQKKVIGLIEKSGLNYELLVSKENEGTQVAMKKALLWAAQENETILVVEEDILVSEESAKFIQKHLPDLDGNKPAIIKLGMFYWGFVINKIGLEKMLSVNLAEITDEEYLEVYKKTGVFQNKFHFALVREKYRRNGVFPWDDEFDMTSRMVGVNVYRPNTPTTLHFGQTNSSRLVREKKMGLSQCDHIGIRKGKFFTQ